MMSDEDLEKLSYWLDDVLSGAMTKYQVPPLSLAAIVVARLAHLNMAADSVGDFKKFLKIKISSQEVVEIISVTDSDGNKYYEVDALSQNVIYSQIKNNNSDKSDAPYVLKPISVPRRFITEVDGEGNTYLQFGYGSDENLKTLSVAEPSQIILDQFGKDYVSDQNFDPYTLSETSFMSTEDPTTAPPGVLSDNAYDPNWGGISYTMANIEAGKYDDNMVKSALYPNLGFV